MEYVVVAALFRGERMLLSHRSPDRRIYPNVWDFPGGHVEPDESPREALVRELREELGIDVALGDLTAEPQYQLVEAGVHLSVWRLDCWTGEPVNAAPDEHDDMRWVDLAEALALDLADPEYPAMLAQLASS